MSEDAAPQEPDPGRLLRRYAIRIATAALSALGLAGFVAVLGAAILYVRFYYAGIPADTALAHVPEGDLVVMGAVSLLLFLLLGAIAVAAVYLIDRHGRPTPGMTLGVVLLVAAEMAYLAVVGFEQSDEPAGILALAAAAGWVGAGLVASARPSLRWPLAALVAALIVATIAAEPALGLGLAIAAFGGVALLRVAAVTGLRFAPYGVAVFLSVALFGAATNAVRTSYEPWVQPAAVLRGGDPAGVCGIFVSETDDRVYLARDDGGEGDDGRIFWVPREDVVAVSVGELQTPEAAAGQMAALRDEALAGLPPASGATVKFRRTERRRERGRGLVVEEVEGERLATEDDLGEAGADDAAAQDARDGGCGRPPAG